MHIVLDTNSLLQIVPRKAKHRWLFDLIKQGKVKLSITSEILGEYEEQLSDFYSPVVAHGVLQILESLENVCFVQVYYKWNLISDDPDDNKFSDCAVAANSDYIVTYDRHFRILRSIEFPPIAVLTLEDLHTILTKMNYL